LIGNQPAPHNSPRGHIQPESVKQFQNLKTPDTTRLRFIHFALRAHENEKEHHKKI